MFEQLLGMGFGKPGGGEYLNSGPGGKRLLAGNLQLGYFGEVSSTELMSYSGLKTHLGFTQGTLNADSGWLKFVYKRKVIYVSKSWNYAGLNWENLYKAGGIYGVNGSGPYPSPAGTPVNQYKPIPVISEDVSYNLIPRVIGISNSDPQTAPAPVVESEFSILLGSVCADNPFGPSNTLASMSRVDLGINRIHMGPNSAANTTYAPVLGYPNGTAWTTYQQLRKTDATGYAQVFRMVFDLEGIELVE